jgi:HD-GYP domain-containing protein (c-di-GMP phosphodiesterase class II)
MIRDQVVMLDNLVLSLSDSIDLVHHSAVDHQQRVAYIALRLAKALGFDSKKQADLMYAAVLHDIGVLSVEEKIETMRLDIENWARHAELGAALLGHFDIFRFASAMVRFHHHPWGKDGGWGDADVRTRFGANVIHLADTVDRMVGRDVPILGQVKTVLDRISRMSGTEFAPDFVECFRSLARQESFWLDFSSPRIYPILTALVVWPRVALSLDDLEKIGQIFSRIVDFRSAFTSTHSIGVATAAELLAARFCFGKRECRLMRIAGHLHDIGKVSVPNAILEKPGKLDPDEFDVIRAHTYHTFHILSTIGGFEEISMWAAHHHERLNGEGYPFRLRGDELPLGSRIMCVADVFTAVTENRPYRKGTGRKETESILLGMVESESLDARIVRALLDDYEVIDGIRADAQAGYAEEYARQFPEVLSWK